MTVDDSWAWAAGLFEGEGCIGHYPKGSGRAYTARGLRLDMADGDVVHRFRDVVGVGKIFYRQPRGGVHLKGLYCWSCARWPEVEAVLREMLPYFGERRRGAAEVLLADPARPRGEDRTHCLHGHELTPDNTYQQPGTNMRACRECRRRYSREARARKLVAA